MADRPKTIRKFERAADQRFTAADFLVENGYHRDGTYLGGYVVECALKALILSWSPRGEFDETLRLSTGVGAKGHDFEYLKDLLKRRKFGFPLVGRADGIPGDAEVVPRPVLRSLARVSAWDTAERYEVSAVKYVDARGFLEAVVAIRDWARRS
jgi:hypothetical protein